MKKIFNWLFGAQKKRSYWTVACQGKYTDVGVTLESYVSSHLFETWQDAARFACRLTEKQNGSLNVLGVVEIRTELPLTYTKIHYDIENEYGQCQVSYYWPEGVDKTAQEKAESLKDETIKEIKRKAREVKPTPTEENETGQQA